MLGVQEYDYEGKPICAECGKSFHRVLAHVRQAHNLTGAEYRSKFGFCVSFAFISPESAEKVRAKTLKNAPLVIEHNLKRGGRKTRFKKGVPSVSRGKMTPQRYLIIKQNKSKRILKPKPVCACGNLLTSRKTKRCQTCYIKILRHRNTLNKGLKCQSTKS